MNRYLLIAASFLLLIHNAGAASEDRLSRYVVSVDEDVRLLTVNVDLGDQAKRVQLDDSRGARAVRDLVSCDADQPLKIRRGRVSPEVTCFSYTVDLRKARPNKSTRQWATYIKDRLTSPQRWLLLPENETTVEVAFDLPDGVQVSVPWEPNGKDETYNYRRRSISSKAIVVFGRFHKQKIEVPGGELRVSILRTGHELRPEKMSAWLEDAATNVAQTYGKFPMKSTQILVVPVNRRSHEPVPFGRVIRDGGEAVQFFVNTARPLDEFIGDWTATHEFSHLLYPYVEDRWVSEGFASYYQNVLMARGQEYTPQRAWRKLYEGFERGKRSAPGMSPNSATFGNGGLMKVYWSGAVVALLADVKLRKISDGKESLDTVMRKMRFCCLPSRKSYTDIEFFDELDKHTKHKVFADLYERYAHSGGFPDYEKVFAELGIEIVRGRVRFVKSKYNNIRDEIMRGRDLSS